MKKIGDVTSTADKNGEWTNGNVAAGIPPTILESGWLNSVQREILNVLKKADVLQNKDKDDQLAEAIGKIISNGKFASQESVDGKLTKDQNGADILDTAKFIENLGLGEDAHLSGNLTVVGGYWDGAGSGNPERVYSPNNKPSLEALGIVDATTSKKGIVQLATNAQMAAGISQSLIPSVSAVMSILAKRSFSASDYIRIPDVPGGLIIQWVKGMASASGVLFAQMPLPFPSKLLLAGAFEAGAASWGDSSATAWGIDFANSNNAQVIAYVRRLFPTTINAESGAGLVLAIGN